MDLKLLAGIARVSENPYSLEKQLKLFKSRRPFGGQRKSGIWIQDLIQFISKSSKQHLY